MAMITYPLNNVQYKAEDAELYNAVRISGVWSGSAFDADVTGNDTIVTVGEGLAWIANTKFSGKVVAQKEPKTVNLGAADPSYNRIDVIAIQFNSVENKTDIIVKKGVASSVPEIPERSTTESIYELYLYSVLRTARSSVISKTNITDLRDNRDYCGYMQDSIKPGYAPSLMEHNKGDDFRFWVGTKAEYKDQKERLNDNVLCIITDDTTEADFKESIEKLSVDYIVDQGTDGIWTYRKWFSGIVEAWGGLSRKLTSDMWEKQGEAYQLKNDSVLSEQLPKNCFLKGATIHSFVQPSQYSTYTVNGSYAAMSESFQRVYWGVVRHWSDNGTYNVAFDIDLKGRWK